MFSKPRYSIRYCVQMIKLVTIMINYTASNRTSATLTHRWALFLDGAVMILPWKMILQLIKVRFKKSTRLTKWVSNSSVRLKITSVIMKIRRKRLKRSWSLNISKLRTKSLLVRKFTITWLTRSRWTIIQLSIDNWPRISMLTTSKNSIKKLHLLANVNTSLKPKKVLLYHLSS